MPLAHGDASRIQVAGYEILSELGRGGMGVVYKARQKSLNRLVALKMILAGEHAGPEALERFRTEAEAVARLQHPNIVQVYEVGEQDGQPFFSLEFIDGGSLADRLTGAPLPARHAAQLVQTLARTMHTTHQQGIVHRDLKPANILLTGDGLPMITDFGLAKQLGGSKAKTQSGAILGTPSYMAPEQAAGHTRQIGPAADVYSLGAILYELVTGRPPFQAESPMETLLQVLERDPAPPRLLNPKVDRDLETICLKCLEKDPAQRYAGAAELAGDLGHYLDGETIAARSFNVLERLSRTLEQSKYLEEFRSWSTMLFVFAAIVFLGHLATFVALRTNQPDWVVWLPRWAQFALLGAAFWHHRPRTLMPTTTAERQLWSIWVGYLSAYGVSALLSHLLTWRQILAPGVAAPAYWRELVFYPTSSLLSGLAFFVMGSSYWGQCYTLGLAFFALAAAMPLHIEWAPLEFGLLWGVALAAVGLHLRRAGRDAADRPGAPAAPAP
jgi:tRNA A-37 threonylcarbamoyl transferase component Bud32